MPIPKRDYSQLTHEFELTARGLIFLGKRLSVEFLLYKLTAGRGRRIRSVVPSRIAR